MSLLRKALLGIAVGAVFLEFALQAGALMVAALHRPTPEAAPSDGSRASVLCVGDSYTFGIGATSPEHSYPAQLRQALRKLGLDVDVVNAGYPGQHSGEVASNLGGQLSETTRVVCILIGANDSWRLPERLGVAEGRGGTDGRGRFRLVWRTGKLFALLTRFDWFGWKKAGEVGATRATPEDDAVLRAAEAIAGYRLLAENGFAVGSRKPHEQPDPTVVDGLAVTRVWEALNAKRVVEALSEAKKLAAATRDSPTMLLLLTHAATMAGERTTADAAVESLEALASQEGADAAHDALCEALVAIGEFQRAVEVARERIRHQPLSLSAWRALQQSLFTLGDNGPAASAIETAIDLHGMSAPWFTGAALRNHIRMAESTDAKTLARLMVSAQWIDGDLNETRLLLQICRSRIDLDTAKAEIARHGLAPSARLRAFVALLEDDEDPESWKETLEAHLEHIHDKAAAAGAKVVLLTYPFHSQDLEQVQRQSSANLDAPLAPIRVRFDTELASRRRDELFVSDGHCSDEGYRIMAEEVAATVAPLLRR